MNKLQISIYLIAGEQEKRIDTTPNAVKYFVSLLWQLSWGLYLHICIYVVHVHNSIFSEILVIHFTEKKKKIWKWNMTSWMTSWGEYLLRMVSLIIFLQILALVKIIKEDLRKMQLNWTKCQNSLDKII